MLIRNVSNPPDTATGAIAIRVFQWDFVVPDDFVVEVRDVEATIGSKLQIDGAEPRVVAGEQIRHFYCFSRGTKVFETVAIDAASHDIATEKIGLKVERKCLVIHIGYTGDRSATMKMFHGRGNKSEAVVGSTKAWIASTSHKLSDRLAMAIGSEPETVLVFSHTEWVDLALGIEFDSRAVWFEAEDIAAGEFDLMSVGALEFRDVIETVASINPTVLTISQGIDHAVGIAGGIKGAEDDLAMVTDAIAIGIAKEIDIGDRKGDHAVLIG